MSSIPRRALTRTRALLAVALSLLGAATARAQNALTVTGRVVAESGQPLANANVELRAFGLGAVTRDDGRYTIAVPAARAGTSVSLTARRLGYRSETRTVTLPNAGSVTVDVTLAANPLQLGEIVVTGAGTSSTTERLGTERKTVDSSVIRGANETNVVVAIAAKAPGVTVQQQSGEAGGGARIQIRGVRSLSGSGQPLFVVDGSPILNNTTMTGSAVGSTSAPNRASDLNPADIENIEILSGPSAAAVYGSLAGNGVVLITTKRGKGGQTTYSLRSNFSRDRASGALPFQRSYGVGTGGVTPTCVTGGPTNCFLSAGFFSWGAKLAPNTPTFDHAAEVFDPGYSLDNTLTVQGGTDRTTFMLSGAGLKQNGYYVGSKDFYNRYTARLNATHRATNALTFNASAAYVRTSANYFGRGNNTNGVLLPALRTAPEFDNTNYATNGVARTWRFPNPGPGQERFNRVFDNPFYVLNAGVTAPAQNDRTFGNFGVSWTPLPWLKVDETLGADFNADDRMEARPEQAGGSPNGGSVTRFQFNDRIIDNNLTARAERTWGDGLRASVLVGQQLNQQTRRQVAVVGNTLVASQPFRLDNTVSASPPTDAESKTRLESYFAQAQIDLWRQLFLTATARNDGSSTFGTQTNRIWYPQASVAWSFTERVHVPYVSYGKLRAAYGESGIVPAAYQLQSVFLGGTNVFADFSPGSSIVPNLGGFGGLFSSTVRGNDKLRPERVGETSVGADLTAFGDRVDAGVTYYTQQTRDGITNFQLAPSSGFTSEVRNAVKMRNIGLEVQANVRVLQTRDWKLELGGNYAFNRNRVQSLGDTSIKFVGVGSSFAGRTTNAQVGYPMGVIRGTDFARCRSGEANVVSGVDVNAVCRAANAPDGAMYIAANGLPIVDPTQRVLGDPNPNYTAGLRSTIGFRKLSLGAFVDVRRGGTVQNMTKASMYQYGTHRDTEQRGTMVTFGKDFAISNVGPTSFPVVGPGAGQAVALGEQWFSGNGSIGGAASAFQEDGSYVRLREVSLSYALDQRWVKRATGMRSIDVRLSGRNLKLWSDYTGFDPETSLSGGAVITQGFDWFNPPTSRSFVLSVGFNR